MKMVVTGPFGAGKTTLIQSISESKVLATERSVSDGSTSKAKTTVAMDFGQLSIDEELSLSLFGTPGQKRFDFMWDILSQGMLGFIILVDVADEAGLLEAADILSFFRERANVPFVVAVNKCKRGKVAAMERARQELDLPAHIRVVACDARDRDSVKGVLLELLYAVLADVDASLPAPA